MQECVALNYVSSCPESPDINGQFLGSRFWQESYLMDLFVCCSERKAEEMQECAASNFVCSCSGSPDIRSYFWEDINNWQK